MHAQIPFLFLIASLMAMAMAARDEYYSYGGGHDLPLDEIPNNSPQDISSPDSPGILFFPEEVIANPRWAIANAAIPPAVVAPMKYNPDEPLPVAPIKGANEHPCDNGSGDGRNTPLCCTGNFEGVTPDGGFLRVYKCRKCTRHYLFVPFQSPLSPFFPLFSTWAFRRLTDKHRGCRRSRLSGLRGSRRGKLVLCGLVCELSPFYFSILGSFLAFGFAFPSFKITMSLMRSGYQESNWWGVSCRLMDIPV